MYPTFFPLFSPTFALFLCVAVAQRNADEEAICQPFLTSPKTSPLVAGIPRNLNVDEEGEFACELVLQDKYLPVQIRATIHEGLGWLAIRHVSMGLQRQKTAFRHFKTLADLADYSADFSYKAGSFALDPEVGKPDIAAKYLHNYLYGPASSDRLQLQTERSGLGTSEYSARVKFIKALGQIGKYSEAEAEMLQLLSDYPYDYDTAHALLDRGYGSTDSGGTASEADLVLDMLDEMYRYISSLASNDYNGFVPPPKMASVAESSEVEFSSDAAAAVKPKDSLTADVHDNGASSAWQPQRFTSLLSESEFTAFVQRREPFVISFGSEEKLEEVLQWKTSQWRTTQKDGTVSSEKDGLAMANKYLLDRISDDQEVLVESRLQQQPVPYASTIDVAVGGVGSTDASFEVDAMNGEGRSISATTGVNPIREGSEVGLVAEDGAAGHRQYGQQHGGRFGWGLDLRRRVMPFATVLRQDFQSSDPADLWYTEVADRSKANNNPRADSNSEISNNKKKNNVTLQSSLYINIQAGSGKFASEDGEKYRPPLHLLKDDIPPPLSMLGESVWVNMTEINLWMGIARGGDSRSRLHMDATDNLYVVLQGAKNFVLVSPAHASHVHTFSPTYAISPDGLSHQFNINQFQRYYHSQQVSGTASSSTGKTAPAPAPGQGTLRTGNSDEIDRPIVHMGETGEQAGKATSTSSFPRLLNSSSFSHHFKMGKNGMPIITEYDSSSFHFAHFDAATALSATDQNKPVSSTSGARASASELLQHCHALELNAGDILYLPAGWFHQVTSRRGRHMAVNYWWRPLNWRDAVPFEERKRAQLFDTLLSRSSIHE